MEYKVEVIYLVGGKKTKKWSILLLVRDWMMLGVQRDSISLPIYHWKLTCNYTRKLKGQTICRAILQEDLNTRERCLIPFTQGPGDTTFEILCIKVFIVYEMDALVIKGPEQCLIRTISGIIVLLFEKRLSSLLFV